MSKVIVDDELRAKLNGLEDDVELCDTSGATIGYVMSKAHYERLILDLAKSQISDEELERRSQEKGGRTLAEIWKSLGAA
jgi:hypothetical protein